MADNDHVTIEPDAINKAMHDGAGTGRKPPIGQGPEGQAPQVYDSGYEAGMDNYLGADKPGGRNHVGDVPQDQKTDRIKELEDEAGAAG